MSLLYSVVFVYSFRLEKAARLDRVSLCHGAVGTTRSMVYVSVTGIVVMAIGYSNLRVR